MTTLTITQARQSVLHLADHVQDEPVMVTRHGRPVMAVFSVEQFEGLMETIEILSDPTFAGRLRKSIHQAEVGKTTTLDEAAARLGF